MIIKIEQWKRIAYMFVNMHICNKDEESEVYELLILEAANSCLRMNKGKFIKFVPAISNMSTPSIIFSDKEQDLLKLTMISVINKEHNPDLIISLMVKVNKLEDKIDNHPSNMMRQLLTFLVILFAVINFIFTSNVQNSIIVLVLLWIISKLCLRICTCSIPNKLREKYERLQLLVHILNGDY